ncbi:protein Lilipod [Trichonephila clavipes]|nr:protein Lilipod [Trichonephila clavipes]
MCTFALGVSIGAALLLPMSIISNEVLLAYPNSYYVQWLNTSLIQVCTPIGFARLFTAIGKLLVKLKAHTPRCHVQDDQIKDMSGDDCFSLESSEDGTFNLRDPGYSPFNVESSGDGSYCLGSSGNNPFKFKSSGDCSPFKICEDGPHNLKKFGDNIFKLKSGFRRSPTASSIHRHRTYHSIPFEEYEENRSTYFNEEGLDRMVAFLQTKAWELMMKTTFARARPAAS